MDEIERRRDNKENFSKKDFEQMTNYVLIKKGIINIEELLDKALRDNLKERSFDF